MIDALIAFAVGAALCAASGRPSNRGGGYQPRKRKGRLNPPAGGTETREQSRRRYKREGKKWVDPPGWRDDE